MVRNRPTNSHILKVARQDDLLNSAQFYKTYRLNLHIQLNTVQLRNKSGEFETGLFDCNFDEAS